MNMRMMLWMVVLAATVAGHAAEGERKVPLITELPKPVFTGTKEEIKVPNLEKLREGKRPEFIVPVGTANLARGKPVTSSDPYPYIGELQYATDGEKEAADGFFVELAPDIQHVQVDLEQRVRVHAVLLWHFHASPRVYHDVVVQLGDDPDFTGVVTTLYNNDIDNSAGLGVGTDRAYVDTYDGRLIDAGGATGRYVRCTSNGNTSDAMNHCIEVEVWGQPVE